MESGFCTSSRYTNLALMNLSSALENSAPLFQGWAQGQTWATVPVLREPASSQCCLLLEHCKKAIWERHCKGLVPPLCLNPPLLWDTHRWLQLSGLQQEKTCVQMNIRKGLIIFFSKIYCRIWGVWDLGNVVKYGLILWTAQWQTCTGSSVVFFF